MDPRIPRLSVVVSSYNQGRFLGECLDSILCQPESRDCEIVLVDDASTDDTAAVLAEYADPRMRVIQHRVNSGLVSTLNDGLAAAHGDYVARIDADDRFRPTFFAQTLAVLDRTPEVGLVYGDVAAIDADGATVADPWPGICSRSIHGGQHFAGNELLALIQENFIPAPAVLARRTTWAAALPVPEWVFRSFPATDWFLNLRMARDHTFCYLPVTVAEYRLHGMNWHRKVGADRRIEHTVRRILDETFADPAFASAKRRLRARVYSNAYLQLATAYAGTGQWRDARRCYAQAVQYRPTCVRSGRVVRGMLASIVGGTRYHRLKRAYLHAMRPV